MKLIPYFLVLAIVLTACQRITTIIISNNSGRTIVVFSEDRQAAAGPGQTLEIRYPVNTSVLVISNVVSKWEYSMNYPQKNFMNGNVFYMRLDADGTLILLKPLAGTSNQVPPQPAGFPLTPRTPINGPNQNGA